MGIENSAFPQGGEKFPPIKESIEKVRSVLARLLSVAKRNPEEEFVYFPLSNDKMTKPTPDEPAITFMFYWKALENFLSGKKSGLADNRHICSIGIIWEFPDRVVSDDFYFNNDGLLHCISTEREQDLDRFKVPQGSEESDIVFLERLERALKYPEEVRGRINEFMEEIEADRRVKDSGASLGITLANPKEAHRLAGALALPFIEKEIRALEKKR